MKRIICIIVLMLITVSVLYAIDAEFQNVEINGNQVSYTISLINNDKDSLYCPRLSKPYYYLVGKELHIQYYELKIPKGVLKDFPFVPYDKIITDSIVVEDNLTIEYVNSSTYVQKKKPISGLNVRKIIFEFGYMEEYDDYKVMVSKHDSVEQREKFYYVTENQKIFSMEWNLV